MTLGIVDIIIVIAISILLMMIFSWGIYSLIMTKISGSDTTEKKEDGSKIREKLARTISGYTFVIIGVLAFIIIVGGGIITLESDDPSEDTTFLDTAKYVFGVLLPVLSAWIGTVIAFYYSRENYEAAVKGTTDLVKELSPAERLRSILAKSIMLRMSDSEIKKLILDKPEKEIKIKKDILEGPLSEKNRLPIVDKEGIVKYVIHKNIFTEFIIVKNSAGTPIEDITLEDLLTDDEYKDIVQNSFETVSQSATLEEVKNHIDGSSKLSDVFITEDGSDMTKAIGWITNVMVTSHATV